MNIKINENFKNIKETYLFSDIAKRVNAYKAANPGADVIRLGIGDVTLPLAPAVVSAMTGAAAEMGSKETFRGYPPEYGHEFLREAVASHAWRASQCVVHGVRCAQSVEWDVD